MTSNPDFKVTLLFDADYLRKGMRYRHNYNEILMGLMPYSRVSFQMPLSDSQNIQRHEASHGFSANVKLLVPNNLLVLNNRLNDLFIFCRIV